MANLNLVAGIVSAAISLLAFVEGRQKTGIILILLSIANLALWGLEIKCK